MQSSLQSLLTIHSADICIWLRDIGSKFADILCREATIAPSIAADTLFYDPSCHFSDLIRNSFIDSWGCRTCYFDPYLAVPCPAVVRKVRRFRRQRLLTKYGSVWQSLRAWDTTTYSIRDKRIAFNQCFCCPTAEQRCQVFSIPSIAYAIVWGCRNDGRWTSLEWEADGPM